MVSRPKEHRLSVSENKVMGRRVKNKKGCNRRMEKNYTVGSFVICIYWIVIN
jgi:hypothetical protein